MQSVTIIKRSSEFDHRKWFQWRQIYLRPITLAWAVCRGLPVLLDNDDATGGLTGIPVALRLTGDSLRKDCLLRFATQSLTPAKPHVKMSVSIQSECVKKVSETHKYQMLWKYIKLFLSCYIGQRDRLTLQS